MSKLAHYSQTFNSSEQKLSININFDKYELKDYKSFDAFVIAEEINNAQLIMLSKVISVYEDKEKLVLILF